MKGRSTCLWWYEGLDILVIMIHQTRRCMWYTVGYYFVSTLYQEQHAPKNSQIPQTLKRCLCSRILDISKAYRLSVDIRTFAPNMSLWFIMYRQVCWRVAWENDRKCTRSSPKNTEMHRTTGFSAVCWCVHSLVQVHAAQPFPGRSGFLISRGFHHPRPCSKSKVFRFGGSNRLWPLWEYLADQMCRAVLYQALVWYVFVVRHTTCNSERDFAATLLYLTISICCLQSSSKINMEF